MVTKLNTPLKEEDVRKLAIGDVVEITGTIVTARDAAHKFMVETGKAPVDLNGGVIYHCGPIVKDMAVVSAGPTTSSRIEAYQDKVVEQFGVRAIIGKGGMGEKTLSALKRFGCVYLSAVGGAGALLAKRVEKIEAVYMLEEFGAPEAFWVFKVKDFPAIVTMDSHGRSLHKIVEEKTLAQQL